MIIYICKQGKMGNLLSGQQFGSTGSLASASDTDQVCTFHIKYIESIAKDKLGLIWFAKKIILSMNIGLLCGHGPFIAISTVKDGQKYQC